ncbi:DUF4097 family beta strand repeat-containing protein [Hamadaea tsunoensis]|uniref:DUF4097 family beta strand repeat-containing protein n=1 Tax=Hamadaea tsunoensis TaxID=53368 RepID=UPI00041DFF62|nr:DUF4097 family beta strand repeat-containing protein [Hamadaea tsunoensis]
MPTFPVTGPVLAEVRIASGRLDTRAEAGRTTVDVSVTPLDATDAARDAAARTTVEMHGDRLVVKTPDNNAGWLRKRSASVKIVIGLPENSGLELRMASADATLAGTYNAVDVHTASGDVSLDGATGDVTADAASGDVRVGRVGGSLKLNTASGDLRADSIDGGVTVHSASGDVTIGTVGNGLKVNTASGDVRIGALRAGAAKVTCASGDVTVGVPAGTSVWMDVHSMSGRVRSDLDPSNAPEGGQAHVSLSLRSMSGDVTITRAA